MHGMNANARRSTWAGRVESTARPVIILLVMSLTGLLPRLATAGFRTQPRILGMASAGTATATGVEAILTNPANLGMPGQKQFELHLFGLGAYLYNSSISVDFYNRYNGDSLDADEKEDILSRFPDDGWKIGAQVELPVLAVRVGRFGFAAAAALQGQQAIPKELIRRPLYGIEMHRTYPLGPFTGSAVAYVRYTLAYAHPIEVAPFDAFAVGAGVSFLQGLAHAEILEADGYFTNDYLAEVEWRLRARTGFKGSGFGLDLGAAAVRKNWRFAVAFTPLFSKISWKSRTEEQRIWIRADSINVVRLDTLDADEVFDKGDSSYSVGAFGTSLPAGLTIGVAYQWRKLLLAFDYHQWFRNRYACSTSPEFAFGVECRYVSFFPVRAGFALGGGKGFRPTFGFGIHVLGIRWDFAFGGLGSLIPSHMRGIGFATSLRIAR